jgi:hypothetical protein
MARSRRKTPIVGITTADTDKPFKRAEHRRERRAAKAAIKASDEPPAAKAFGNPWAAKKDGKQWLVDPAPELTRK